MYIHRFRPVPLGCALLTALACSSPQRDLGQIAEGGADGGADMPVEMDSPESTPCPLAARDEPLSPSQQAKFLSEFVGTWIGHAEDALGDVDRDGALPIYAFPSGSTRILLEVSSADEIVAKLTFGEGEPLPASDPNLGSPGEPDDLPSECDAELPAPPPTDVFVYSAKPVARALDLERSGEEAAGEELAIDGKLVLAFSTSCATDRRSSAAVSELHLRFAGDGLVGVFDGLELINERGFLTRPGSVRLRRAAGALGAP